MNHIASNTARSAPTSAPSLTLSIPPSGPSPSQANIDQEHAYSLDSSLSLHPQQLGPSHSRQAVQESTSTRRSSTAMLRPPFAEQGIKDGAQQLDSARNLGAAPTVKPVTQRLSMFNLHPNGNLLEQPSSSRSVSPSSPDATQPSPSWEPRRRPFSTLLPRDATHSPSSVMRSPSTQLPTPLSPDGQRTGLSPQLAVPQDPMSRMTAWEFLHAEPAPPGGKEDGVASTSGKSPSPPRGKGNQRAEVPIMELRIIPITDTINMFGSTQTSSNYSLSGKVVVRVHNIIREVTKTQSSPFRKIDTGGGLGRGALWLPEITTGSTFLDPDEFFANQTDFSDGEDNNAPVRVQEVNVMSLTCTFSGYALYVDHSGRFSACRLAEVTEELLPQGFTVSIPELGKSQEYEIEFNLSLPGWLPGSLLTRFGGTFYSLEANARYTAIDSELQHAIPSSLVPPRRGSMLPDSPSDGLSDAEQLDVPLRWQNPHHLSDEEDPRNVSRRIPKTRAESTPPSTKSTWLSKRAKQLTIKAKSSPTGASASTDSSAAPRQSSMHLENKAGMDHMPPKLYASKGYIRAFSDPVVIVVRRCREVVPVPVARMALVGPDGATDGAIQDPPTSSAVNRRADPLSPGEVRQDPPDPPLPSPSHQGPPVAPTTFDVPGDPAKAAAHIASRSTAAPNAPLRSSSTANEPDHPPLPGTNPSIPMRHFLHRPMLHPPAEANLPDVERGLPFSLTLSLPSYVAVDGPGSDILNFGVQIEVGRSPMWGRVRELGGLRLRDMELSCIQTERHCSVPSRTFCHVYPLPPEPRVSPYDLPVFAPPTSTGLSGQPMTSNEMRQRRGYDRGPVQYHIDLLQSGRAPHPSANNVERVRTVVVGPPPSPPKPPSKAADNGRGKDRENERNGRRRSLPGSGSQPNVGQAEALPRRMEGNDFSPEDMPDEANSRRHAGGRGRRAYQSAIRGLSNLATAVMDISFDPEGSGYNSGDNGNGPEVRGESSDPRKAKGNAADSTRAALYSFAGADGHGVDLTRGRVRMAIKLPLVASNASRAKSAGTPQLIPDFESPFTKTRHKLQVKLGFGFGSKPLGGEGEWGQSLVMCVPVRFTESAPREVREQFAPMPIRQVALGMRNDQQDTAQAASPDATAASSMLAGLSNGAGQGLSTAPVLPSYNQIFREDGSRLADEGEDLPQYPGPRVVPPTGGSVTAPLAAFDESEEQENQGQGDLRVTNGVGSHLLPPNGVGSLPMSERSSSLPGPSTGPRLGLPDRMHSYDNRIAPSHVLDESIPADKRGKASRAMQRLEMEELHRDEQEQVRRMHRLSSRVDEQDGVQVATERLGQDSGQEGDLSDSDTGRLMEETVNVDEEDAFDDDMPAFAAGRQSERREEADGNMPSNESNNDGVHSPDQDGFNSSAFASARDADADQTADQQTAFSPRGMPIP